MRWWRREGVGGPNAVGWLALLLGGVLAVAGCASSSTNVADAYASVARIGAEYGDREGVTPAEAVQALPRPSEPPKVSPAPGSGGPLSALLSSLVGPPRVSSAIDEEALIARAIAEHEMRNP